MKNHNLTLFCEHGHNDMCDYCLVAYYQHTYEKKQGPHRSGGESFVCASCLGREEK